MIASTIESLFIGSSAPKERGGLRSDTQGAVMFMGLFMACFLAGALWSLVGIGDAIVHRELAQEAADSAAFSSAVVHAKGMNLISFLNLFMFMVTFIYLVLCVIVDVLLFIAAFLAGWSLFTFGLSAAAALRVEQVARQIDRVAGIYMRIGEPALKTSAKAQTAIARIAPYAGAAMAFKVGRPYKFSTVSLSASMVSGGLAAGAIGKASELIDKYGRGSPALQQANARVADAVGADGDRIGLPVKSVPMGVLCKNVVREVAEKVRDLIIYLGTAIGVPSLAERAGDAARSLGESAAAAIEAVHCSANVRRKGSGKKDDDSWERWVIEALRKLGITNYYVYRGRSFWGDKDVGPKVMSDGAQNGATQMYVYSVSRKPLEDKERAKVTALNAVSSTKLALIDAPTTYTYNAQAEFYFDCSEEWGGADCNGESSDEYPFALYGMRWRGRLIRAKRPGDLAQQAVAGVIQSGIPEPNGEGWVKALSEGLASSLFTTSYH